MDAIKNIKDYAELFSLCKWMKAFFLLNTQDSGYHQTFLKMLEGREIEEWKTVGVFPQVASEGPDFWLTNLRHGQDRPSQFLFLSVQLGLVEEDSWKMLTSCQPTLQSYFLLQKAANASSQLFHSSAVFLTAPVYLGIILQQFWPELAWPERYLPP